MEKKAIGENCTSWLLYPCQGRVRSFAEEEEVATRGGVERENKGLK